MAQQSIRRKEERKEIGKALRVTAHMLSPVANHPPMLDGLLTEACGFLQGRLKPITRSDSINDIEEIPIPILSRQYGDFKIHLCSNPVFHADFVSSEYVTKRLNGNVSYLLKKDHLKSVPVARGPFKMHYRPIRLIHCRKIVWFCVGTKKAIQSVLERQVSAIGGWRGSGYGVIKKWEVEDVEFDASIQMDGVLMRTVPVSIAEGLRGWRKSYGAYTFPYWHPENYLEIAEPC